MRLHAKAAVNIIGLGMQIGSLLLWTLAAGQAQEPGQVQNLSLTSQGGQARSWEPHVTVIPEHEPFRASDGSLRSYWAVRSEDLPADLGIEWAHEQNISSVVVRYFDGRMVRGPAVGRTQEGARLQFWSGAAWKDIDAQLIGQETSSIRYTFSPVSTTRVRLLFTEPPDPEMRRTPEKLGIFVCEFEAYRDVPFQFVNSRQRVVVIEHGEGSGRIRYFNEPPSGDSRFDFAGPLVIEPKQTRVFSDTLNPTLIVAETAWARQAAEAEAQAKTGKILLRNGFLQLEISTSAGLQEARLTNRITGESVATPQSAPFLIRTGQGENGPQDFKLVSTDTSGSDAQAARARFNLTAAGFDVSVHYELRRQDHFYHKWLTITNKTGSNAEIRDVVLSSLGMPRIADLMAGQELTYPVARLEKGGFFSAIETIYWDHRGDTLTYYPGATLAAGKSYSTEKAVVGVYKNQGEMVAGWDRGLRDWVTEYHAQVSPVRGEWPDVYCEGWSAKVGVKELLERPQWAEHVFATAQKMGIRYMDGYEPAHEAAAMPTEWLQRFADLASRYDVNTGFWIDFGSNHVWNTGPTLKPPVCHLSPEGESYFQNILSLTEKFKFRAMHWADFYTAFLCDRTDHGHLPGKYSLYAQSQRMLKFGDDLRAASPGLMLGADGGFTNPQSVRHEDSRAHGTFYGGGYGDHFSSVEPDIHIDRLYGDMNRVYAYGSYIYFLRPWFRMLNCVNHFGQESHQHDRAGYRYGLLSALANAGQVTINDMPDNIPESEIEFTQHWLQWAKTNKDYLRQGHKLFDRTGHYDEIWQGDAESLSGLAHIRADRGYIFLFNPTAVEQIGELTLALETSNSMSFFVREIYPGGMTLQGPANGQYPQGGKLRVTVPAKQARVLWIAPSSENMPTASVQVEDARAMQYRRYVGEWKIAETSPEAATLRADFQYPEGGKNYLSSYAPEADWAKEPWAYDKAYLVFLLKDETIEQNNNWIADKLAVQGDTGESPEAQVAGVRVNGVPKTLHPFKTIRVQKDNLTRCFFVDLSGETGSGKLNQVEIKLPIRQGLVFSGAYLDLPDQMPDMP